MVAKPCADFYRASTWICEIETSSNADEWGPLVSTVSISSGFQSRPTETRHLTRSYCSNKFAAGCRLAFHLENMRPCNFPSMTPSGPVNSMINLYQSSSNAVPDLFFHQCRGRLYRFSVGCAVAANTLDLRFSLQLAPDRECTSNSCLKFSAQDCGWAVRLKLIGLACMVDCKILLQILLLALLMLQLLASKLSSASSQVIQQFSNFFHCT